MPLSIFHLICILFLMMKMNIKQFFFNCDKIRAEGYSTLNLYHPELGLSNETWIINKSVDSI